MFKRIKSFLLVIIALFTFCVFSACGDEGQETEEEPVQKVYYRNPLVEKDLADPHIIKHDGYFYVFSTGGVIHKSADTLSWTKIEGGVNIKPKWGSNGAGFWAPDIVKIGNKFVLYYSLSTWGDENPGIGAAYADHPEGPWTDHGKLFLSKEIGVDNSIDPTVFIGQDDKVYMIWGSFRGIFGVELDEDGLALKNGLEYAKTNKVLIAGVVGAWDGSTYEGCYVIYKDGYYYMFVSSGTCCEGLRSTYNVRVARSRDPLGEYIDSNGASMKARNVGHQVLTSSATMIGPGHNSVFIDDNNDYFIVYHVYQDVNGEAKGRYLAMDRLLWNAQGWCQVKNRMPSAKAEIPYIKKV